MRRWKIIVPVALCLAAALLLLVLFNLSKTDPKAPQFVRGALRLLNPACPNRYRRIARPILRIASDYFAIYAHGETGSRRP